MPFPIYIHLIIEEETETPEIEIINDEIDEYTNKIEKCEKNFEEILNGIKKEEIYNNKILSDNIFKTIEKNNFSKQLDDNGLKDCKTMVKTAKSFLPEINEEKLLKRLGLGIPFIIELNKYFMDYGMVSKYHLTNEKLVGELWK